MNDLKGIIEDCNKSDLVSDKVIKKIIEIIGQEEWHDLHDENSDICTTMGELIITLKGIADLEKENAELKAQVNKWLNAYSDTSLIKVLRDCIYKNEKLSSQEQQQLSAWVECAMDFGSNLDECANQLTKAKGLLERLLITSCNSDVLNLLPNCSEVLRVRVEAEQFLSEVEK